MRRPPLFQTRGTRPQAAQKLRCRSLRRRLCSAIAALTVASCVATLPVNADAVKHSQRHVPRTRAQSVAVRWIPIGPSATTMAISPNGKIGYFTNAESGTLTIVNLITHRRHPVHLGWQLTDVAISPDGNRVYVTSHGGGGPSAGTVFALSTATDRVVANMVTDSTDTVAFSPNGKVVYVQTSSRLLLIDVKTNRVIRTIATGHLAPALEAVSPNGRYVYLASDPFTWPSRPGYFEVVNIPESRPIAIVNQGKTALPCSLAVNSAGALVYESFCGALSGTSRHALRIRELSASTGRTKAILPLDALGLAVNADGSRLYAADPGLPTVHVISTSTNEPVATIPVGPQHSSAQSDIVFPTLAMVGGDIYAPSFSPFSNTGKVFVVQIGARP